jgi:hypothetical protein
VPSLCGSSVVDKNSLFVDSYGGRNRRNMKINRS